MRIQKKLVSYRMHDEVTDELGFGKGVKPQDHATCPAIVSVRLKLFGGHVPVVHGDKFELSHSAGPATQCDVCFTVVVLIWQTRP